MEETINQKTEKRSLRYDFTAPEIHDLSIELAQKNKELVTLEGEMKAVQSQYSSKVKVVKSGIAKLSNQVADGWELRDIECDIFYHKPSKGKKTIIRKDTNRAFVEPMESWEWNLFTQPDEDHDDLEKESELDDQVLDVDFEDADIIEDNEVQGPKLLGN